MNTITGCHFRVGWHRPDAASCRHSHHLSFRRRAHHSSFPFTPGLCVRIPCRPLIVAAKKRAPKSEPILKPSVADDEAFLSDEEDELLIEEFEGDELLDEDDFFKDESLEEDIEIFVGDGAGGGGISLAGTPWDQKALEIAQEVALSFGGEMGIYAFRTLKNAYIQVRLHSSATSLSNNGNFIIEHYVLMYSFVTIDEYICAKGLVVGRGSPKW